MNKCFLFTAALLFLTLVTGCQKDSDAPGGDTPSEHRTQINISLDGVGQSSETRAAVADIDLDDKGFTIAGYYTVGVTAVDGSVTTAGNFATQIATAKPNVFDLEEISTGVFHPAVRNLKKDATGKYHVLLSKWALLSESYLSYVAWSVATNAAVGAAGNPITSATAVGSIGQPFIAVAVDGKTDVVAASSLDQRNDVVRGAIDLDFKHIFSKLRFHAIAASDAATVTVTSAKLIANASISKSARYDFNVTKGDYAGSWGTATSTTAATYPLDLAASVAVTSGEAKFLTDRLVIPQTTSRGDFSVELTYTLANGSTTSTYTRTVALPAQTLLQNTSYTYTFTLSEDRIEVGACNIGTWILVTSTALPQIAGPRGDVKLLLDASEPPYVAADGTKYWLDRSGYNNHVALSTGFNTYDAALKAYRFNTGSPGGVVPALGDMTEMTMEVVATCTSSSSNDPLHLQNNTGGIWVNINYQNKLEIYMNRGNSIGDNYIGYYSYSDVNYFTKARLYTFQWTHTKWTYYDNMSLTLNSSYSGTDKFTTFTGGTLSNSNFAGDINYVRVTGKATTPKNVNSAYLAVKKKFRLSNDSYVQDGLLIDLQGVTPLYTYNGKTVWLDNSVNENHAELINEATAGITHDPATKCYQFTSKGSMQFMKEIANTGNDMTIEVVVKSTHPVGGAASSGCVLQFNTQLDGTGAGGTHEPRGGVYWPYATGASGTFLLEAPHASGVAGVRFNETNSNLKVGSVTDKASISFIRSGNTLSFRHNGNESGLGTRTNTTALPAWKYGRVGAQTYGGGTSVAGYAGHIYAIRLYNRTLTDAERAANYALDKKTYNL